MIRRFGTPPQQGRTYTRRPGAYAILPLGDGLLVTRQSEPEPEIQLPGGGIDPGESPLAALHREVYEETEYDLWAEKICNIYVARPVRQVSDPREPGHIAMHLPIDAALAGLGNPGDRHFVAQFTGWV